MPDPKNPDPSFDPDDPKHGDDESPTIEREPDENGEREVRRPGGEYEEELDDEDIVEEISLEESGEGPDA
jgi:hypothetical protein